MSEKMEITDFFGIGNAIRSAVQIYRMGSRHTGRTLSLVNSLKEGDRVVFTNEQEAKRVERLAKERGVKLSYMVVNPKNPERIFERGTSEGRTIFDHTWVEEFYENAINKVASEISFFETQASGFGEAHKETQHKAMEMMKWRI